MLASHYSLVYFNGLVQTTQPLLGFFHIHRHRSHWPCQLYQTRFGTSGFLNVSTPCHGYFDGVAGAFRLPSRQGGGILNYFVIQRFITPTDHNVASRTSRSVHPPIGPRSMFGRHGQFVVVFGLFPHLPPSNESMINKLHEYSASIHINTIYSKASRTAACTTAYYRNTLAQSQLHSHINIHTQTHMDVPEFPCCRRYRIVDREGVSWLDS